MFFYHTNIDKIYFLKVFKYYIFLNNHCKLTTSMYSIFTAICAIALDHRMGSLKSNLDPQSEPQQMISAVHEMFDLMYELEVLPSPWKYYDTKKLKRFFKVLDLLYGYLYYL